MKCFLLLFYFLFITNFSSIYSESLLQLRNKNDTESYFLDFHQKLNTNISENFIEKNNLSDYHVKEISQQNRDDSEKKKKLLKKLKDTLEKYYELKKNKARKLKKTDDDYFLKRLFQYDYKSRLNLLKSDKSPLTKTKLTNKEISLLKEQFDNNHIFLKEDKIDFSFREKIKKEVNPTLEIKPFQKFKNSLLKIKPYNIILQNTKIISNSNRAIHIKNELYQKIMKLRNDKRSKDEKVIPIEKCNINWNYKKHGNDWNCMCQCGKRQSPINIELNKKSNEKKNKEPSLIKTLNTNDYKIFFDFKDPKSCQENTDKSDVDCKKPLIKNTGKSLEIEYDCGIIVMPPHNNGYKCYKIEIHSPSEHKINNEQFDLELQIYYKIHDRRIIDSTTTETISVVTFFKGLEKVDLKNIKDTVVRNHPFLNQLDTACLPKQKGEAKMLNGCPDFSLLFDKSKQPYQYKKLNNKHSKKFSDLYSEVTMTKKQKITLISAINDLTYNKNYPLNEYYTYLGSFTSPPCIEDVTYILATKPLLAPLDQIIEISKIISKCSFFGNNRNVQKANGRDIYQFKEENVMETVFDQLNLVGDFSPTRSVDYYITGDDSKKKNFNENELSIYADHHNTDHSLSSNKEECNDEDLIDKIIDIKDKDVDMLLKSNNLK